MKRKKIAGGGWRLGRHTETLAERGGDDRRQCWEQVRTIEKQEERNAERLTKEGGIDMLERREDEIER